MGAAALCKGPGFCVDHCQCVGFLFLTVGQKAFRSSCKGPLLLPLPVFETVTLVAMANLELLVVPRFSLLDTECTGIIHNLQLLGWFHPWDNHSRMLGQRSLGRQLSPEVSYNCPNSFVQHNISGTLSPEHWPEV